MAYSKNWNSRENKERRRDAEWEQVKREWNQNKDDIFDVLLKPLGWALAVPAGFAIAVWLVARAAS